MDKLYARQKFCEKVSKCLVSHLNEIYCVSINLDKCLIQRMKHASKKTKSGFQLTQTMTVLLQKKYTAGDDKSSFFVSLKTAMDRMVHESQEWDIVIESWYEEAHRFVINIDKARAITYIINNVLNFSRLAPSSRAIGYDQNPILCHVNQVPMLEDIRSLLFCELLSTCECNTVDVFVSWDSNNHPCDSSNSQACHYEEIAQELGLKIRLVFPNDEADHALDSNVLQNVPKHFADCLQDPDKPYPNLLHAQCPANGAAFASRTVNNTKNLACHKYRETAMQERIRCIHICNQKNRVQAQQTELFNAWYYDTHCESKLSMQSYQKRDGFFTHSGVRCVGENTASDLLRNRKQQVKESFEAKLQVNAQGDNWEVILNKMRSAVIRLEFFKNTASNQMSLAPDHFSTDVSFILYNYSRLSTLLDAYEQKVTEGYYPKSSLASVDFRCLKEEAEWELVSDHLWVFHDVIRKPIVTNENEVVKINSHHLVEYLQQLCRSVSSCYSRHHILVENLFHLIPTVNARIHLMKAVKNAMDTVFLLLSVEPLSQM